MVETVHRLRLIYANILFCVSMGLVSMIQAQSLQVDVDKAWVRATVSGQKTTGAFMTLKAKENLVLQAVSSSIAKIAEIHTMRMAGDIMHMQALQGGLPLPAGEAVQLQPGSYHIMLINLNKALDAGSTIPVTLDFKDEDGISHRIHIAVPVMRTPPKH